MDFRILDQNAVYSSPRAILGVAIPACILNCKIHDLIQILDAFICGISHLPYTHLTFAFKPLICIAAAAPLTALVQASLLGTYIGTSALGAFGAVSITAGFATRVFNFLVDGVSAKTGKSVGLRAWGLVAARVRMSLGFALTAGALAAGVLSLLIRPVSVEILKLSPEVQAEAQSYWWLRVALVPIMLLNMSVSGILQGFRHVRTSATINTCQGFAEMIGSYVVLKHNIHVLGHDGLFAMGIVTYLTQFTALLVGLYCIFSHPPPEAPENYSLAKELFGGSWSGGLSETSEVMLRAPLLADDPRSGDYSGMNGGTTLLGENKEKMRLANGQHVGMESGESLGSTVDGHMDSSGRLFVNGEAGDDEGQITQGIHNGQRAPIVYIVDGEDSGPMRPPLSTVCESPGDHQDLDDDDEPIEDESLLDFVRDGFNMFVRSMILQMTFFATLVAASRLGTAE